MLYTLGGLCMLTRKDKDPPHAAVPFSRGVVQEKVCTVHLCPWGDVMPSKVLDPTAALRLCRSSVAGCEAGAMESQGRHASRWHDSSGGPDPISRRTTTGFKLAKIGNDAGRDLFYKFCCEHGKYASDGQLHRLRHEGQFSFLAIDGAPRSNPSHVLPQHTREPM
ncbi:hypothetical protein VTK73DRAFT_10127 [Phialemonium thermophilum]|uniref:Uncharacterized protein n=1 Tax=Phialemonium thermophilum TaxID=223376 RepID=A0ABR3VYJ5_9PEZI